MNNRLRKVSVSVLVGLFFSGSLAYSATAVVPSVAAGPNVDIGSDAIPLVTNQNLDITLPPPATCSGPRCPDYNLTNLVLGSFDGHHAVLHLSVKKVGHLHGKIKCAVNGKVNGVWVNFLETTVNSDGSANGLETIVGVDAATSTTELIAVLKPGIQELSYDNNRKSVPLSFSDLGFNSYALLEKVGTHPNRDLVLNVLNSGPTALAAGACDLSVVFDQDSALVFHIPALQVHDIWQKKLAYDFPAKSQYRGEINCRAGADQITHNNAQTARLH